MGLLADWWRRFTDALGHRGGPVYPLPTGDTAADLLAALNAERKRLAEPLLTGVLPLERSAAAYAAVMQTSNHLSHVGPDGSTFVTRERSAGYGFAPTSEIIAYGQRSASEVVADWMSSPGHRAAILDPASRDAGGGRAGEFWCVDFGSGRLSFVGEVPAYLPKPAELAGPVIPAMLRAAPDVVMGVPRGPGWPAWERERLKGKRCLGCGRPDLLTWHHIIPYHRDKSREFDPDNGVPLCRGPAWCHWHVGHGSVSWEVAVPDPRAAAKEWGRLLADLKASAR
jgi:hypothetical protein